MKKIQLIIVFIGIINTITIASHVAGGSLTYKYIGDDNNNGIAEYEITYDMYRDCDGPQPLDRTLVFSNPDNITMLDVVFSAIPREDITFGCVKSGCNGGSGYGIRHYQYIVIVELAPSDWTITLDDNFRNKDAITTIENLYPQAQVQSPNPYWNMRIEMNLNNKIVEHSSPKFANHPTSQILVNEQFSFLHGAINAGGDELIYEEISPMNAIDPELEYLSGYTYTQPFGTTANYQFEPSDGSYTVTPDHELGTIMAVKINIFRNINGVRQNIGSVMRDMQVNVINEDNNAPQLGGFDNSNNYTISVYAGEQVSFFIEGSDPDFDPVSIYSNDISSQFNGLANVSANNANPYHPRLEFNWVAGTDDVGLHCFTVVGVDDPCSSGRSVSTSAQTMKTYCINVVEGCMTSFSPHPGNKYVISAWVKESNSWDKYEYTNANIKLFFEGANQWIGPFRASGQIIEGWQKIESEFIVPQAATDIQINLNNISPTDLAYFDDIRVFPFDANMKSFVYDPTTLKLVATLDENNYATFYTYDDEGKLEKVSKETTEGVKTLQTSRGSAPRNPQP